MVESTEKIHLILKKDWDYPPHPVKKEGYFIGRKDELNRLKDILKRRNSGSILVSGDRGVGKTSLVYKALQDIKDEKTIFVILNGQQLEIKHDDKKDLKKEIIKNLIRRFYASTKTVNKTNNDIETLYKKVISSEFKISEKIAKVDVESEEEKLQTKKEFIVNLSGLKGIILSVCVGFSVYLELNPVTSIDILDKLLPLFILFPAPLILLYTWKKTKTKGLKKEKTKSAEECYKYDHNIGNLEYDFEQILLELNEKGNKIIFVIDELDKLVEEEVIQVITNFKNLFNLSSSIFILISGKEIFNKIEDSKALRTTNYTLFTNRLFISRPSFEDIEAFIDEIIESPNIEDLRKNEDYKEFRNYLCYKAKTDFFDLYNIIPDYISDFNDNYNPIIGLPKLTSLELLESRLQKAMGQIFDLYKFQMPSRWYDNEKLLSSFYVFLDELIEMSPNIQFNDIFEKDILFISKAKRDFCKYLARLGVIWNTKEEKKTVDGTTQIVTTYKMMKICVKVPNKVTTLMEFENIFVNKFDMFCNKLIGITNAYRRIIDQPTISLQDLRRTQRESIEILKKFAATDYSSSYEKFNNIRKNLKKIPPDHYKREDLEQYGKNLDDAIINLKNISKSYIENILKEIFPDKQFSQLKKNANLFSVNQELRNEIIGMNMQHIVIFNQDLSKQILLTLNITDETIQNNKQLIMQNTNTLKIVNIQTNPDIRYRKIRSGFWNINISENFGDMSKVIKKIQSWL